MSSCPDRKARPMRPSAIVEAVLCCTCSVLLQFPAPHHSASYAGHQDLRKRPPETLVKIICLSVISQMSLKLTELHYAPKNLPGAGFVQRGTLAPAWGKKSEKCGTAKSTDFVRRDSRWEDGLTIRIHPQHPCGPIARAVGPNGEKASSARRAHFEFPKIPTPPPPHRATHPPIHRSAPPKDSRSRPVTRAPRDIQTVTPGVAEGSHPPPPPPRRRRPAAAAAAPPPPTPPPPRRRRRRRRRPTAPPRPAPPRGVYPIQ
eukprot:gene1005-biopygen15252